MSRDGKRSANGKRAADSRVGRTEVEGGGQPTNTNPFFPHWLEFVPGLRVQRVVSSISLVVRSGAPAPAPACVCEISLAINSKPCSASECTHETGETGGQRANGPIAGVQQGPN